MLRSVTRWGSEMGLVDLLIGAEAERWLVGEERAEGENERMRAVWRSAPKVLDAKTLDWDIG